MSIGIIVKKYEHYNRPMGIHIRSKSHYDYEMKSRGYVSLEEGKRLADKHNTEKKWKPSKDCVSVIQAIKGAANKKGNIILGQHPKIVDAMKKKGMSFDTSKLPKDLPIVGGIKDGMR